MAAAASRAVLDEALAYLGKHEGKKVTGEGGLRSQAVLEVIGAVSTASIVAAGSGADASS